MGFREHSETLAGGGGIKNPSPGGGLSAISRRRLKDVKIRILKKPEKLGESQ